jgi:uncharacterized membrane protein YfcA
MDVVGVTVQEPAAMSLVVVAASSLYGSYEYARTGHVNGKATLAFAWTGMVGVRAGAYGHYIIPKEIVLVAIVLSIISHLIAVKVNCERYCIASYRPFPSYG